MVAVRQLCFSCAYSWCINCCITAATNYNYEPNHRSSIALQPNVAITTASNSSRSRLTISALSLLDKRVHATAITPGAITTAATTAEAAYSRSFIHGLLATQGAAAIHRTECDYQQ